MLGLTSTFVTSPSLVPTTCPPQRLRRPRPVVPMIAVCMNQSCKEKVVVIMGVTGTGKSRLSIDLSTRFSGEVVNSVKMQVCHGLELATNLITIAEQCGVPHHLLGEFPPDLDLTASECRSLASRSISEITSRGKLPILTGGSNTFIHSLLVDRFDPQTFPFSPEASISSDLRYECCFLWVDVSTSVLFDYLSKRVDQMLESGLLEQLAGYYNPRRTTRTGVRRTIGVAEFDRYFSMYPPEKNDEMSGWEPARKAAYEKAVQEMKENTHRLTKKQMERIMKLKSAGWELHRLDATESFRSSSREIWDKTVLAESVKIVKGFLDSGRSFPSAATNFSKKETNSDYYIK